MSDPPRHDETDPPEGAAGHGPVKLRNDTAYGQLGHELKQARLAIRALMSHLETVQTDVLTSTERVRRTADDVARAIEDAAGEQLRALREQVEAAGAAVDLITTGMAAIVGEDEQDAPAARKDSDSRAATKPAALAPLAEDVASSAAALLEQDEPTRPDAPGDTQMQASDAERARLAAVNMALNGTPRDETARHLADSFDLDDADATTLLDDVYRLAEEVG